MTAQTTIIYDPIHGTITLEPILLAIIDTPQFQRLRDMKQLGMSYWVFPGGCHNRFEHCLGTSYLCGLMLSTLKDQFEADYQDETVITGKDILCVQIAGLLHDIGHGPFSHTFEDFIRTAQPGSTWTHEGASIALFDYLLESNLNVQELFHQNGLTKNDIALIKRMIQGRNPDKDTIPETARFQGKTYHKWFLYEIVSNKRTGIDCDKFDYFARDAYNLGLDNAFNHRRYFKNIKVLNVGDQLQICVRDKEMLNLYELFHVRSMLHHQVYQHKGVKVIEQMAISALLKADKKFAISASVNDIRRYTTLTDSLYYEILRSVANDSGVQSAQEILHRIQKRDLYEYCGEANIVLESRNDQNLNVDVISNEILSFCEPLNVDDIFVLKTRIGNGMNGTDPLLKVTFFTKTGDKLQLQSKNLGSMIPNMFNKDSITVYSKDKRNVRAIEEAFELWLRKKGITSPSYFVPVETTTLVETDNVPSICTLT